MRGAAEARSTASCRNFTEPDNDDSPAAVPVHSEVEIALADFIGSRFVLRWQAFHGIGYAAIIEFQPSSRLSIQAGAVTELEKCPIEQDTGKSPVTGVRWHWRRACPARVRQSAAAPQDREGATGAQ